jgi:hypothetical protein
VQTRSIYCFSYIWEKIRNAATSVCSYTRFHQDAPVLNLYENLQMLHHYGTASALMLASAMAFSLPALAQNVDVPFSGNVPVQATFSNIVTGTAETQAVAGSAGTPNIIESVSSATVTVQSNTPATMTVSPPRLLSGPTPDPDGTNRVAFLSFGSTNVTVDTADVPVSIPAGVTDLEIRMRVERPEAFTVGTYNYAVTLTVTP